MEKNNLGVFATISDVWRQYPYGGSDGDVVTVGGKEYYWHDIELNWLEAGSGTGGGGGGSEGMEVHYIDGNLTVSNDLFVGGTIHANDVVVDTETATYRYEVKQEREGILDEGEQQKVRVIVYDGYGQDVSELFPFLSVVRNSGSPDADHIWNAEHTRLTNPFTISWDDIKDIKQASALFTFTLDNNL